MSDQARTTTGNLGRAHLAVVSGTPMLLEARRRRRGRYERFAKPVVDRSLGLVMSLLTLPIVIIVSLAVFIDLGRPVILRQERVGKDGKRFNVYKLRTMHPDRRQFRGRGFVGSDRRFTHKSDTDPRHTELGRFLRKWSLDELPQLWNVVLGHMSLVGPRPEMVQIVERYQPWQHQRHEVKPGITGLWQISARGELPMHEATHIDLEYLARVSFMTDLKIMTLTIPAALGARTGQ
jgi:lipopolysaccharide/colanic/teichoic acid biosynthesis glycosyltransferase